MRRGRHCRVCKELNRKIMRVECHSGDLKVVRPCEERERVEKGKNHQAVSGMVLVWVRLQSRRKQNKKEGRKRNGHRSE